jgi:hypothetical protein
MAFRSSVIGVSGPVGAITIALGLSLAIAVSKAMWSGYVLSVMWGWFLVPLGAPKIGVAHAIGIAGLVAMIAKNSNVSKDDESFIGMLSWVFFKPLITLAGGWVAKMFM